MHCEKNTNLISTVEKHPISHHCANMSANVTVGPNCFLYCYNLFSDDYVCWRLGVTVIVP